MRGMIVPALSGPYPRGTGSRTATNSSPKPQPRQRRYSVRQQARPDRETQAKLEALAAALHRKRAAILRYVMQWGLVHTTGWTVDFSIPGRPYLVHALAEADLLQKVQDAAGACGTSVAAWLRLAMRQVTPG